MPGNKKLDRRDSISGSLKTVSLTETNSDGKQVRADITVKGPKCCSSDPQPKTECQDKAVKYFKEKCPSAVDGSGFGSGVEVAKTKNSVTCGKNDLLRERCYGSGELPYVGIYAPTGSNGPGFDSCLIKALPDVPCSGSSLHPNSLLLLTMLLTIVSKFTFGESSNHYDKKPREVKDEGCAARQRGSQAAKKESSHVTQTFPSAPSNRFFTLSTGLQSIKHARRMRDAGVRHAHNHSTPRIKQARNFGR